MSDIVERLGYHHEHPVHGTMVLRNPDGPEAADEIARLRAAFSGLVGAIADHTSQQSLPDALKNARAALEEKRDA